MTRTRAGQSQAAATPDTAWHAWSSRLVIAGAFVALCAATIGFYALESTLAALAMIGVDGVVALLWVAAAAGFGAWLVGPWTRTAHPALRVATAAAVGLGALSLVLLGLGLAGGISRPAVWVLFFGGLLAGGLRVLPEPIRHGLPEHARTTPPPGAVAPHWVWLPLAVHLGMAMTVAAIAPGVAWKPDDPHPYDVLSYHLQVPREWYELGRIAPLPHNVFSHFPMGMEVHFLAGMHLMGGPWKGMYFASFLNVTLAAVMALGVFGACRTLRPEAGRVLAVAAAVLAAATPWVLMLASVPYAETGLMLFAAMSVAWLLIFLESRRLSAAILAGALGGFACGVKYTAVPMLVITATFATAAAVFVKRTPSPLGGEGRGEGSSASKRPSLTDDSARKASLQGDREPLRPWRGLVGCGLFGLIALLAFSPWLMRNIAWTGNPVFPLAMRTLGQGHFDDKQVERFERAHAMPEAERALDTRIDRFGRLILADWQFGYLVVPLAVASIAVSIRRRWAVMLLILLAGALVIWVLFTHMQGRFVAFLLPIAGLAIGLAPRHWASAAVAATAAVFVAVQTWTQVHPRLAPLADYGRAGLFGAADLAFMVPEEIDALRDSRERIALVGDGAPFPYPLPMSRLSYRTVFDIPGDAADIWQAWGANDADMLVVNPPELKRLHRHYAHIPAPPADLERLDRPFVIRRQARDARAR